MDKNEKVLIEGRFKKTNIASSVLVLIGLAVIVLTFIVAISLWGDRFMKGMFDSSYSEEYITFLAIGFIIVVIGLMVEKMMSGCALTVTSQRIYGKAKFGRYVELPVSQISSASAVGSTTLRVATSSGVIAFYLVENRNEILKVISDVVIKRQQATEIKSEIKTESSSDELVKLKDLLDKGIITQEEFDTKKKQLLEL